MLSFFTLSATTCRYSFKRRVKDISYCTIALPAHYYIVEFDAGLQGVQPHNFVTIGGVVPDIGSHSMISENNVTKQFEWLNRTRLTELASYTELASLEQTGLTDLAFRQYLDLNQLKPSKSQLVINTESTKLEMTFLNTLPESSELSSLESLLFLPWERNEESHILDLNTLGKKV